jgi:hypothetical protein
MVNRRFRLSTFIYPCTICLLCSLIIMGCAGRGRKHALEGADPCATLDSLYASAGFESPLSMTGKITFDVEQYRIRGQFTLTADPQGEMGFDFSSSVLFGSRHEDISMSITGGVVRVLDRERGMYYEAEEVDAQLTEMIGLKLDVGEIIPLVLGAPPPCGNLQDKDIGLSRNGEVVFASRFLGRDVRVVFDDGTRKISKLVWPLSFDSGETASLEVDFTWHQLEGEGRVLKRLVLTVPRKGWRVKLVSVL